MKQKLHRAQNDKLNADQFDQQTFKRFHTRAPPLGLVWKSALLFIPTDCFFSAAAVRAYKIGVKAAVKRERFLQIQASFLFIRLFIIKIRWITASAVISAVFPLPGRENETYSFSPGSAEICSGITTAIPPALILEETVWKAVFRFHFDGYIQYCVCTDVSASLNPLHFLLRGCPIRSSGWGLFLSFDYAFKLIRHLAIPHKFRCYFQSFMQKTVRPESRSTGYEMCSSPFSTLTALLLAFGLIVLYVFNPNIISDSYHGPSLFHYLCFY